MRPWRHLLLYLEGVAARSLHVVGRRKPRHRHGLSSLAHPPWLQNAETHRIFLHRLWHPGHKGALFPGLPPIACITKIPTRKAILIPRSTADSGLTWAGSLPGAPCTRIAANFFPTSPIYEKISFTCGSVSGTSSPPWPSDFSFTRSAAGLGSSGESSCAPSSAFTPLGW